MSSPFIKIFTKIVKPCHFFFLEKYFPYNCGIIAYFLFCFYFCSCIRLLFWLFCFFLLFPVFIPFFTKLIRSLPTRLPKKPVENLSFYSITSASLITGKSGDMPVASSAFCRTTFCVFSIVPTGSSAGVFSPFRMETAISPVWLPKSE